LEHFSVGTADGRRVDVTEAGDRGGRAVVVHHGTPGANVLAPSWVEDAQRRGIRLITFARAGYAGSSRRPRRSVAQVTEDVATVLDFLGIDRFASWGLSGGGPHALACAALMPQRLVAVASISGPAPYPAVGLDWTKGMGESNVKEFGLAIAGDEEALLAGLGEDVASMRTATLEAVQTEMGSILSAEDRQLLQGEMGVFLVDSMRAAAAQGGLGGFDDDMAFVRPWGFDPAEIRVPTQVWQGANDLMVPFGHGQWLVGRIPGAEAHLDPELGHLTVAARRMPEVHEWLLGHF
jgi:pimeloyl-ACP methyl ester carboxylesterase